jgi:hypothetical protein
MAVALHSVWNYALAAGVSRLALAYAALCAVFVVLLIAVIMDRRRIIALLRRYLREYEPTGIIAGPDVAMLSSLRDGPQARQWARLTAEWPGCVRCPSTSSPPPNSGCCTGEPSAVSSTTFRSVGGATGCWQA